MDDLTKTYPWMVHAWRRNGAMQRVLCSSHEEAQAIQEALSKAQYMTFGDTTANWLEKKRW